MQITYLWVASAGTLWNGEKAYWAAEQAEIVDKIPFELVDLLSAEEISQLMGG